MFIGHAKKPRCFTADTNRQYFYHFNQKAWMTSDLFKIYLQHFNHHVGRKVLLLIDNAPSHIWKDLELPNLEIISLPPNTTSKLHHSMPELSRPLNIVIAVLKCIMVLIN
jgi:DDE superfamily endonuclease